MVGASEAVNVPEALIAAQGWLRHRCSRCIQSPTITTPRMRIVQAIDFKEVIAVLLDAEAGPRIR
jgi:hypothetical protein